MTRFVLVKASEVTPAQINFSLSPNVSAARCVYITEPLLYLFDRNVHYKLLEFDLENAKAVDLFADTVWLTLADVRELLAQNGGDE